MKNPEIENIYLVYKNNRGGALFGRIEDIYDGPLTRSVADYKEKVEPSRELWGGSQRRKRKIEGGREKIGRAKREVVSRLMFSKSLFHLKWL